VVIIDEARVDEADILTRLALASKQYWGYDDDFIELCRSELVVDANDIESQRVFIARDDAGVLGFYVMRSVDASHEELDMLFVEPASIGRGVGGALMLHAIDAARDRGALVIVIVSDPNAAPFYEHCGGTLVGSSLSSSTGRTLPVYEVPLYSR
jgi:GNAT superfamily N-acetyltransferase